MRLLCTIILTLFGAVDRVRNQFPVSNSMATQFVSDDPPGLAAVGV